MSKPKDDPVIRRALIFLAIVFVIIGLEGLLLPEAQMSPVEISLNSPSAHAEIRAAYGGCFLAFAALFIQGIRNPGVRPTILMVTSILLGVFSAARVLSWFVDGAPNNFSHLMHHLETTGFILSAYLWRRSQQGKTP
jgi:hypothetical protein